MRITIISAQAAGKNTLAEIDDRTRVSLIRNTTNTQTSSISHLHTIHDVIVISRQQDRTVSDKAEHPENCTCFVFADGVFAVNLQFHWQHASKQSTPFISATIDENIRQ